MLRHSDSGKGTSLEKWTRTTIQMMIALMRRLLLNVPVAQPSKPRKKLKKRLMPLQKVPRKRNESI